MKIVLENEFITSDWSGGTTSQIYIDPKDANVSQKNFNFRISSATCDLDESEFTKYSEFTRYITPITGDLSLNNNGENIHINPYEVYCFDGNDKVISRGKVRDYNLIIKKDNKGLMYSKKLEDEEVNIKAKTKKCIIFNYDSKTTYIYEGNSKKFEEFSAIILDEDEEVLLNGNGKLLICEIK